MIWLWRAYGEGMALRMTLGLAGGEVKTPAQGALRAGLL
jgi:hypothetical protein